MKTRPVGFRTLSSKLLAIQVPLVCVIAVAVFSFLEFDFYRGQRASLIAELGQLAQVQGVVLESAVWEFDEAEIQGHLDEIGDLPHVLSAVVLDQGGNELARVGDVEAVPEAPEFRTRRDLTHNTAGRAEVIGVLEITVHSGPIRELVFTHIKTNVLILATLVAALIGSTLAVVLDATGWLPLPRGVFAVSSVPFRVDPVMVVVVAALALALAAAAAWFPSRRIARREPAEGLRYE